MSAALLATAVLAAVLFYFSLAPFGVVLATVSLLFALRPNRRPWPAQESIDV